MSDHSEAVERWLPVVGYEGYYEVSDLGRVRGVDRTVIRSDGLLLRLKGRDLSLNSTPAGHKHVKMTRNAVGSTRLVHQLVLEAFKGPRPPGMESCHENGVPSDNRANNLRWDTHLNNIRDIMRHGHHRQASRTVCPTGHILKMPNLVAAGLRRNKRICLACNRAQGRAHSAERANRPYDIIALREECYAQIMATA